MPYSADPSPTTAITGRSGRAMRTPVAPASANPRPPIAALRNPSGRRASRRSWSSGRSTGASSTTTASSGSRSASAASTCPARSGSPAAGGSGACGGWYGSGGVPSRCGRRLARALHTEAGGASTASPAGLRWTSSALAPTIAILVPGSVKRPEALGEADEGFPRLGVVRARADDERRCLRALEKPGELLRRGPIGRGRANDAPRRCVLPLLFGGCAPVVHRHDHESRAALRLGLVRRPADRAGDVLRTNGLLDPDQILAAEPAELAGEEWLEGEVAAILLAGEDDERRPVDARSGERAHRIAQARGRVEEGEGRISPPDRPTRREAHDRALVQAEHKAQVLREVGQERHLGGAGVAEDRHQALLPEDFERRVANRRPTHGAQYHGCRSSV